MKKSFNGIRFFVRIRGLLLFLLFLAIPQIVYLLINFLTYILTIFKLDSTIATVNSTVFHLALFTFIFFIIIGLVLKFKPSLLSFFKKDSNWIDDLGQAWRPTLYAFTIAFFATYIIFFLSGFLPESNFIKQWIRVPNQGYIQIFDNLQNRHRLKVVFWILYVIVFAPIIEEFIFRGMLQQSLERLVKKKWIVILATSIVFAYFHNTSLSNMVFTFIVGIWFSYIKIKTTKINVSIMMHSLINLTGLGYGLIVQYLIRSDAFPV